MRKDTAMGKVIAALNNRYLIAIVTGLFILGALKSFSRR